MKQPAYGTIISLFIMIACLSCSASDHSEPNDFTIEPVYLADINSAAIVPINPDYSNVNEFVDSLFNSDVRNYDNFKFVINSGVLAAYFSEEVKKVISTLKNIWMGKPDPWAQETDILLMNFIRNYIDKYGMCLYVPIISFAGSKGDVPVYYISGYKKYDFSNPDTVTVFIELFVAGAHFVVIDSKQDSKGKGHFLSEITDDKTMKRHIRSGIAMNSHYTALLNIKTAHDFPNGINTNVAPIPCPFVCVMLFGDTALLNPNTFLQMEGWPAYTSRHNFDYELHEKTLWNISTYGLCAFSEKRATAVFLADRNWNPLIQKDTVMPHYRGADTPQSWLRKDLIIIK